MVAGAEGNGAKGQRRKGEREKGRKGKGSGGESSENRRMREYDNNLLRFDVLQALRVLTSIIPEHQLE